MKRIYLIGDSISIHYGPHLLQYLAGVVDYARQAYNAVADRVMAAARVPCIDLYGFTCLLGPDLYCDHVHFKEPIREKQAAFLAGWLARWSQS